MEFVLVGIETEAWVLWSRLREEGGRGGGVELM